ncbi:hypothetical protein K4039_23475 [Lyngbya sp. CCAP 1446/10]|uniref:SpvB/TcaC N-terminal domain-containing protein n=1 Tax=Lyngbya sp. CCAP 1446/10 TaxID=439293 RepID=UPI0035C89A1A|nr:hypothetical protein [Lyngbya sp. CCAP 1446/10]
MLRPTKSLPKGGSAIEGIVETFHADEFTGTALLSVPIPISPSRSLEPMLRLAYSFGAGIGEM